MSEYAILHKTSGLMAGVLCCLALQLQSAAQGSQGGAEGGSVGAQGGFLYLTRSIRVSDETGSAFVNPYRDVAGSPYLRDAWTRAAMRLNGNVIVPDMQVRLDLKSQQWHFLDSGNIEDLVPVGLVREVLMDDSSGTGVKTSVFRSGFPPVDSRKTTDFYQVVSDGKVLLLHSMTKVINIDKDEMAGSVQMEFVLYEDYYLFSGGKMWRVKKDKSEVLNQLADKKEKIQAFIDENHFKLKSVDELKKVIDYYNTLP
jgi:hypothetical protein